jgi:hypothetical protein
VTVYMDPDVEAKAKEIGAGNLSGGVRVAVRTYRAADRNGAAKK